MVYILALALMLLGIGVVVMSLILLGPKGLMARDRYVDSAEYGNSRNNL